MTKITDLEASFEQYKAEQEAIHTETKEHRGRLEEKMDKNKAEADQQFAEIMRVLQTLQPATATVTNTIATPSYHSATTIPPSYPTQPLPVYATTMPPPYSTTPPQYTQPLIFQRHPTTSSAAYTSFSGLHFDSQGYPLPPGATGVFSGPFSTGEYSNHQNRRVPVSTEGVFQNFSDFSLGSTGGIFTGPGQTTPLPNHGFDRGWGSGTDYRLRKLKMPLFNGDDVYDWVYQAERFFDIQGLFTTGERLRAAMMCLEGPALSWYRWSTTKEPFRTWEELKSGMLIRFQSSQAGSLHEQFFSISQNGTARDYVTMFEKMAAQLPGLSEKVQEGVFIKGLKPDLRVAVRTQRPVGVTQAMELAVLIDEAAGKGVATKSLNKSGGGALRTSTGGTGRVPFKRMTEAEMADKRRKGLCFQCDGQFGPGHRCLEKSPSSIVGMLGI